ncbi:single-stranded DNA-binding protein [Patescibacteria group bacterium]|nr:single-stranded DNA-binding protein [Patescibacteria group bacterium]MBU1703089.1 single-stranded DNA-binding protein [Patescibacteria group bacterium]MBU1954265.1 single-stranded DNA-binding protein [Patescibacteria group bacterium]
MSLNRAQLIGNLTRDPELRQVPGGATVATFSVATNFSWTDQSGQRQDKAEYHNVVAWRKLAEICGQYLKKGGKVFIEGRIQTRDWEGEDGQKRYRTEIVADNMIMLDRKGEPVSGGYNSVAAGDIGSQSAHAGLGKEVNAGVDMSSAPVSEDEVTIDDLPF